MRATVHHYDVDEDAARGEAMEKDLLLNAAYLQLQIMKKTTQEEEEVCLDERLVAVQSALRSDNHRRWDTTAAYP